MIYRLYRDDGLAVSNNMDGYNMDKFRKTLISIFKEFKVFERVVRSRISGFLESNNLLDPNQHGFRCGRDCLRNVGRTIFTVLETQE